MPDRCPVVTAVGIVQRPGGVEEEEVVLLAVVDEPEVPHPGLGEAEHGQPFTPEEAMQLMNERWKAMNSDQHRDGDHAWRRP